MTKNAPAVVKPAANLPAELSDAELMLAEYSGVGMEHVRKEDLLMPRLAVLQALSPQINPRKPEFIEGARVGQVCNVALRSVWDSIQFLPVIYQRRHIEWKPRKQGGGLVKDWGMDESIVDRCEPNPEGRGPLITPDKNELVIAGTWYGLNLTDNDSQCFIAMASSQLRTSRAWMTKASSERIRDPRTGMMTMAAPLFYRSWNLTTIAQNNDQGDWVGWKFEPAEDVVTLVNSGGHPGLIQQAKALVDAIKEGTIVASAEAVVGEEDGQRSGEGQQETF